MHSPFAFDLITRVIYEKGSYYRYSGLDERRRQLRKEVKDARPNSRKVDRLLFRLVNRMQPATILEAGTSCGLTTLYLAAGKEHACCHTFDDSDTTNPFVRKWFDGKEQIRYHRGEILPSLQPVLALLPALDFLYLNETACAKEVFEACLEKAGVHSLFVVKGIHRSKEQREWWKKIVADPRTGITFDLYEVGLVFFDLRKTKQHYVVNF